MGTETKLPKEKVKLFRLLYKNTNGIKLKLKFEQMDLLINKMRTSPVFFIFPSRRILWFSEKRFRTIVKKAYFKL